MSYIKPITLPKRIKQAPSLPRPQAKPSVKMKYVILITPDKREYEIHASDIAAAYAAWASNDVIDQFQDDVYWSHYHICWSDNRNIISFLDKIPRDWILSQAHAVNTDKKLLQEDYDKNWNGIKKDIVTKEIFPHLERDKHRKQGL
mgnify:CR=1 FL=1